MDPSRSGTPVRILAGGATDIGRVRKHNEDAVLLRPDLNAYILADGAGGHNAGNVASALATTSVANHLESTASADTSRPYFDRFGLPIDARRLAVALQHANHDIIEIAATSNRRKGMGTTAVVALFAPEHGVVHVAHVGDSRCYRLRDGFIEQLTMDHSLLNDVLQLRPDLDEASLARLPGHVVTRALGMEEPIRVSVRSFPLAAGDRFVLCSDGLTDVLGSGDIAELLRLPKTPDEIVALMIQQANSGGGSDNVAVVVIECESASSGPTLQRFESFDRPRTRRAAAPSADGPTIESEPATDESESLESAPEIVIMSDAEPELEWESPIHVVPAESASEGLMDALEDFATPFTRAGSREHSRTRKQVFCPWCGALMDADADKCEGCGEARTKS
jgi:protein phosphatase